MSNIALLVDCHKIINWLEDRKKLRKDWYNYLKAGEEKIKTLLKDREWIINYPAIHDYLCLNQQTFNYIDVEAIVQLLLQTDLAQKNLIFGYSDKRVKEWTTLKKYMQNNSLSLLSTAKFIQQSLRFDLPALSKSIQLMDNQLGTLKRKIDFNQNTIFQQTNALTRQKQLLGVQSQNQQKLKIDELITLLITNAPNQIQRFDQLCRSQKVNKYLTIYNSINSQTHNHNYLDTLTYYLQNGDDFVEVYMDQSKREVYSQAKKYGQFQLWRGSNEWQIQIQGESHVIETALDRSTILQSRQIRQKLLYDLSQLQFFYKGLKFQMASASKGLALQIQSFNNVSIVQGDTDQAVAEIQRIIQFLISKRLTAPLELKNSKKVYQILVSQFGGYQANLIAMNGQISAYKQQIKQIELKRKQQVQKLNYLRNKLISSKSKCENWLTDLVRKQVRITGEINKLQ